MDGLHKEVDGLKEKVDGLEDQVQGMTKSQVCFLWLKPFVNVFAKALGM